LQKKLNHNNFYKKVFQEIRMKKEIRIILYASKKDRRRILPFFEVAFEDAGLDKKFIDRGFLRGDAPNLFGCSKINFWTKAILGEPYFRATAGDEQIYRGVGGSALCRCGLDDILYVAPRIAYEINEYLKKHRD